MVRWALIGVGVFKWPVCAVFKKLSGDQAVLQMAVYLLANLVGIGLGLYKVNAMGLLPTSQSDWLEFMVVREVSAQSIPLFNIKMFFAPPGYRIWRLQEGAWH